MIPATFCRAETGACHGGAYMGTPYIEGVQVRFPMRHILLGRVDAVMVLLYAEFPVGTRKAITWTGDMIGMN